MFVGDTDTGTECTLSSFADDMELSGVNTLEGRDVMQRDLDRCETWACAGLMKLNKTKCKDLYLGQGDPNNE